MAQVVYCPSVCDQGDGGASGWPGNVEVDALNPCAAFDNRPPTAAAGGSGNGLAMCFGGTTALRLGLDAPCGASYDVFRVFWRFPLDVDKNGDPLPASTGQVLFKFAYRPDLSGVTGVRTAHLYWVDLTGKYPRGAPGQAGNTLPEWEPAVLGDLGSTIVDFDPVTGVVTLDVTTAYNAAKAAGRADLWLGGKLDDESDDGVGTPRYYTIIGREHPDPALWPRLELSTPAPQAVRAPLVSVAFSSLEPCATIVGQSILDDPARGDLVPGYGDFPVVRRGNTLYIEIDVRDQYEWPGAPADATEVFITLYDPAGTAVVVRDAMARVSFSRYSYRYRTQPDDPLGIWSASFEVTL